MGHEGVINLDLDDKPPQLCSVYKRRARSQTLQTHGGVVRRRVKPVEEDESSLPPPPPPPAEIARQRISNILSRFSELCAQLQEGQLRMTSERTKQVAQTAGYIMMQQQQYAEFQGVGYIPGVQVGDWYSYMFELVLTGLHRQLRGNICYVPWEDVVKPGIRCRYQKVNDVVNPQNDVVNVACSIIASSDDVVDGETVSFTGLGPRNRSENAEIGNLALLNSCKRNLPVRVIRRQKDGHSPTGCKYTFLGLYNVESYFQGKNAYGQREFKFFLRQDDSRSNSSRIIGGGSSISLQQKPYDSSIICDGGLPFSVQQKSSKTEKPRIEEPKTEKPKIEEFKTEKLLMLEKGSPTTTITTQSSHLVTRDLSEGVERTPVRVVNNVDVNAPEPFHYIDRVWCSNDMAVTLQSSRGAQQQSSSCNCVTSCEELSQTCSCIQRNYRGALAYNEDGHLIQVLDIVYECGSLCGCGVRCPNKVSQRGLQWRLEVFKTANKGWGVRSLDFIPSGSFLCELTGELITAAEASERENDEYLFDLDFQRGAQVRETQERKKRSNLTSAVQVKEHHGNADYVIDAGPYGNVARFINHSCDPNLFVQGVMYDHDDIKRGHIMLFAGENIPAFTELSYDYGYELGAVRDTHGNVMAKVCHCGAAICRKRLY
jgi:euchromatic histone-lysine N-methyltransferase